MDTSGLFSKAISKAIQTSLNNDSKALGYKAFKILDVSFRDQKECAFVGRPTLVRYDVLIKHKAIDGWKNLSAFEVLVYSDGNMRAMFNGFGNYSVGKTDGKIILTNVSISYGSFTKAMANAWLKRIEGRLNAKR